MGRMRCVMWRMRKEGIFLSAIQIGYRVGRLTAEEPTGEKKAGYTVWKCRCDCGGEIALDTRCLQRGTFTSSV